MTYMLIVFENTTVKEDWLNLLKIRVLTNENKLNHSSKVCKLTYLCLDGLYNTIHNHTVLYLTWIVCRVNNAYIRLGTPLHLGLISINAGAAAARQG